MRLVVSTCVAVLAASPGWAAPGGTIEGTATTVGGTPLNGMCGVLYDAKATTQLIAFAGTGTDGTAGHYTQANVPPGHYTLLFVNCGANTDGKGPNFNYTPIFFGSTWNAAKATKVVVTRGATTSLGPQAIPLGGSVVGTVKDKTTKHGADTVPIMAVPPGGTKFFLAFSWTLVCSDAAGAYNTSTFFQQGVPTGATLYFAPNGWGCTDSQGVFNAGKFIQSKSKPVTIPPGSTIPVDGAVKESAPQNN
ncbi:MAG: hypothetical protein WDN04_22910 [Rhodospirillales bacterium]